jgi:hypothetical protein
VSAAHTPGPWAATHDTENSYKFFIRPSTFGQQGRTFGYKPLAVVELDKRMTANSSAAANATLIAAAPDLLEALKLLQSAVTSRGLIKTVQALSAASAAIAKATGAPT